MERNSQRKEQCTVFGRPDRIDFVHIHSFGHKPRIESAFLPIFLSSIESFRLFLGIGPQQNVGNVAVGCVVHAMCAHKVNTHRSC